MSRAELSRPLTVWIFTHRDKENFSVHSDILRQLGHTPSVSEATREELIETILNALRVADVIMTDITNVDDLQSLHRSIANRQSRVPFIVVYEEMDQAVIACIKLDFVFSACKGPADQERIREALIIAISLFERSEKLHLQTQEAEEKLKNTTTIAHATDILMDYLRIETTDAARSHLQDIASSYNRTLVEQAQLIVQGASHMHPRKTERERKKT